jgi:predicted nucleic acid-binding protein
MKTVYLDTSAIVKRYIQETGSDVVAQLYTKAWVSPR